MKAELDQLYNAGLARIQAWKALEKANSEVSLAVAACLQAHTVAPNQIMQSCDNYEQATDALDTALIAYQQAGWRCSFDIDALGDS